MSGPTDADRAKAAEVMRGQVDYYDIQDAIAAALAEERAGFAAIIAEERADRIRLTADLRTLAEEWEAEHADWCCQRGCPSYQSVHPGPVEFTTDGGISQIGPDFPCPGECTCYVGPFRDRLRAVVAATEEAMA